MSKLILVLAFCYVLVIPVSALEFTAPEVPKSGLERMPQNTNSFGDGVWELLQKSIQLLDPDFAESMRSCMCVMSAVLLFSLVSLLSKQGKMVVDLAGVVAVSSVMLRQTGSMIRLASDVVWEIFEYGKLLCPVLTAAMAAQGSVTASAALYAGTTLFIGILGTALTKILIPLVYVYLLFSIAGSALGEAFLKRTGDCIKSLSHWILKTLLIIFTTYMGITGVVSGTTDAAALKAAKVTISSVVPVVGGILSDVSESVLVSVDVMKNAAGVYGILAVLAVFAGPFLKVGVHYLALKLTAACCSIFGNKQLTGLVDDFSSAMGLLLAMIGSGCLLVLISTVCFLKGVT